MRKWMPLLAVTGLWMAGCSDNPVGTDPGDVASSRSGTIADAGAEGRAAAPARGRVVVANRASGTISVIDTRTDEVVGTFDLPAAAGEATPEPMYVVYSASHNRVFVGDRANDRVAVFDARSFEAETTVPAGRGVFHMWADPQGQQLWVNNDIDNTSTVIDPATLDVIATVATPADLVAMTGKPHDVILGPQGDLAYVTVIGVTGDNDYVIQFDTGSFQETARAAVGKDPHVSLARQSDRLYVPCQNSDVVIVLDRLTLETIGSIPVPGAHGAGMSMSGQYFYTTNLPGGGTDALFTIDTGTNTLVGSPVYTPYPVPHNLSLITSGHRLHVTHSGASSDKVTVYAISGQSPVPVYETEVTVGLNPFGIDFVP